MATGFVGKLNVNGNSLEIVSTLQLICETAASNSEKYIGKIGFDALHLGMTIHVWFKYTNTASNPTLDINGTGAHSIYLHGTTPVGTSPAESWYADSIVTMTLRGTSLENSVWVIDNYRAMSQSSAVWGAITGNLENQSDLNEILKNLEDDYDDLRNNKQNKYGDYYTAGGDGSLGPHVSIYSAGKIEIKTLVPNGSATLELYGDTKLGIVPTVLWTNPSPTASFAAQEIALSQALTNFDYYEIVYRVNTSQSRMMSTGLLPTDWLACLVYNAHRNYRRLVSSPSDTSHIEFSAGHYFATYGTDTTTTANNYCVPYKVIGFK